jgi:D-amino-acid dehydrogenase
MARADAIVLGAGIVGTSIALHLAKRGLAVALVDRRAPGEETSYGNAGIIEGNTIFPPVFPSHIDQLLKVALKRAPEANYHLLHLPRVAPWLWAYRKASRPDRLMQTAQAMRPLYARAIPEHEALLAESGAERYLRRDGWIKIYRSHRGFLDTCSELELAIELDIPYRILDAGGVLDLEPALAPEFEHAVLWPEVVSLSNPLAVTRAYAAQFAALGGAFVFGDARTLAHNGSYWRVDTKRDFVETGHVIVALGPWTMDVVGPLGIRLPLGIKRGYQRHFHPIGNTGLTRPVVDAEVGYCVAPMEQGLRLTTGAEFADRDAPPTPVQFDRLMPYARSLFPLGDAVDGETWMGARPCFPDSRPVIGPAPGQPGLWLAFGHAHWGLTLGPATGRLIAELLTGETPFCDPEPYAAERFV